MATFGERRVFLEAYPPQTPPLLGLGIVNCNQGKMPEGEVALRLGEDPEILMEASGFAERSKFPVSTLSHYSGALNAERNGSCWPEQSRDGKAVRERPSGCTILLQLLHACTPCGLVPSDSIWGWGLGTVLRPPPVQVSPCWGSPATWNAALSYPHPPRPPWCPASPGTLHSLLLQGPLCPVAVWSQFPVSRVSGLEPSSP